MTDSTCLIIVWGIRAITIIVAASWFAHLGYKLFDKANSLQYGEMSWKSETINFVFKGKGMGIFFMLAGAGIIIFMILYGSVSLEKIMAQQKAVDSSIGESTKLNLGSANKLFIWLGVLSITLFTIIVPILIALLKEKSRAMNSFKKQLFDVGIKPELYENSNIKILIVEDEPNVTQTLQDRLGMCGYSVVTAKNGAEGLEKIVKEKPDLVLLDIIMPIMDGHKMLKRLREIPEHKDIPVIMLTARSQKIDISHAKAFGVIDYLVKPFGLTELQKIISRTAKDIRTTRLAEKAKGFQLLG